MRIELDVPMEHQPDGRSCGPTCLRAVYRFFGDDVPLDRLIAEIPQLETGGTLAVQLGCHALRRGYLCDIYTYNVQTFDPSWFHRERPVDIRERLLRQLEIKGDDGRRGTATMTYLEFLRLGGRIRWQTLSPQLLEHLLAAGRPVLTGLSSTYLYDAPRELPETDEIDDVGGEPAGHFVVLSGMDPAERTVIVSDPWPSPGAPGTAHERALPKVQAAILLGVLTYDANLLVIRPRNTP
jgi:hypothetical protein